MLCFEFLKDSDLKIVILSCEETFRYSAYREDGVFLAATVVFRLDEKLQRQCLYAVHPRTLDHIQFASNQQWQGKGEIFSIDQNGSVKEYSFPVQHIYSKICNQRMTVKNRQHYVKLFQSNENITTNEPIPVKIITQDMKLLQIELLFDLGKESLYQPYTCLRINGLDQLEVKQNYVFRIYCHISDPSFGDLIVDDERTSTRLYRTYGAKFINEYIKTVHIPDALEKNQTAYQGHKEFYLKENITRIVPGEYSITAVDNFNCNPARLHCLKLTEHLWNVTGYIDKEVYNHPELINLREDEGPRIHWFVNCGLDDLFYLQLRGPIAIPEKV